MINLTNNLAESELTKIIERISVAIYLYDRNNILTDNQTQVYYEKIIIKKDICSKNTTQDYSDISKYGEGDKPEVSIYGELSEEDAYEKFTLYSINDLSKEVIKRLFTADFVELSVTGTDMSEKWIDSELSKAIFTKFSNVTIKLQNASMDYLGGDIRSKSLNITGCGALILGDSTSVTSENISINNITISCSKDKIIEYNLISKNVTLDEISVITPVTINVSCEKPETYYDYKQTACGINRITFRFSDNEKTNSDTINDLEDANKFNNALLSVTDFYMANISDIIIDNAYCYKGVKLEHLNELHLNGLNRSTYKNIGNYTIGISDINRSYISDVVVYSGYALADNNEYAIFISEKGLSNLQTLSIDNITLNNVYLMNIGGCKADEISISNCTSVSETFISSDSSCMINKFSILNLDLTTDKPLNISCPNLNIYDSRITVIKLSNNDTNELNVYKTLKMKNVNFYGDDSNLNIHMYYDSSVDISESEIIFNSFKIDYIEDEYTDTFTGIMSESNKVIYFKNTNITSNDNIEISGAYRLSSYKTAFNSKNIIVKNIKNLSYNELNCTLENSVNYEFENCSFKNSTLNMRNVSSEGSIKINNSTGNITYKIDDIVSEESNKISVNTTLESSNVDISVDTVGLPVQMTLISNNSIGSCVFGNNSNILIVPSMKSSDITSFKSIKSLSEIDNNKINYGNSDKELTVEDLLIGK